MAARIHPTAIVDDGARLGEDVVIGPHVIVERDVVIGDRCELMVGAVVHRHTTLGAGNVVGPYCVLGGVPQDTKFDPDSATFLRIGSGNVFREYVTVSRATTPGGATVIGEGCYFMTQSHVGHDSTVADRVIMTNNAALAGHVELGAGAILSANASVHQFCWVGELVMMRGCSGASQHIPPFVTVRDINAVVGLNVVGLRRASDVTAEDRRQVQQAYRLLYRSGLTPTKALAEMDACDGWGGPASRFREFIRRVVSARGPNGRGLVRRRTKPGRG